MLRVHARNEYIDSWKQSVLCTPHGHAHAQTQTHTNTNTTAYTHKHKIFFRDTHNSERQHNKNKKFTTHANATTTTDDNDDNDDNTNYLQFRLKDYLQWFRYLLRVHLFFGTSCFCIVDDTIITTRDDGCDFTKFLRSVHHWFLFRTTQRLFCVRWQFLIWWIVAFRRLRDNNRAFCRHVIL